jgi:flotillin
MLEHLDNLAEASSRAISNTKFDKVVVWDGGGQGGRNATADFLSGLARTMPPMMQVLKDVGGVELPESLVKLAGDADAKAATPPAAAASRSPAGTVS